MLLRLSDKSLQSIWVTGIPKNYSFSLKISNSSATSWQNINLMIGILKIVPKALSSMCFGFSMVSQTFWAVANPLTSRTFGMFRLHMLISGNYGLEYLETCSTCDSIGGNSVLRFSWIDQRCWYSVGHRYRFHLNICRKSLLVCS